MATIPTAALEVARTVSGNSPLTLSFPEAASQTFKRGDIVTFDSVGHVIGGSSNQGRIVGVAAQDGANLSTAGASLIPIWIANEDTVFRGNSDGATHNTDVGRAFKVEKVGTIWLVDKSGGSPAAADKRVIIVRLDPRDAVGDTNGRYEFVFYRDATAFAFTS